MNELGYVEASPFRAVIHSVWQFSFLPPDGFARKLNWEKEGDLEQKLSMWMLVLGLIPFV
jgi:hypothetical protein